MVNNNEEKIPLLTLSTLEKSNTDNWKRVVHPGSGNCVTRFTFRYDIDTQINEIIQMFILIIWYYML
jgi:hypothetical protein